MNARASGLAGLKFFVASIVSAAVPETRKVGAIVIIIEFCYEPLFSAEAWALIDTTATIDRVFQKSIIRCFHCDLVGHHKG